MAYVVAVAPVFIFTGPGDVSRGENLGTAAYLVIPVIPLVVAGAVLGSALAKHFNRGHFQERPQ